VLLSLLAIIRKSRSVILFLVGLVISLNVVVWQAAVSDHTQLEVTFLDTGDATTAYIDQSSGPNMLINGGEYRFSLDRGATVVLPFLHSEGVNRIDRIVVTNDKQENIESLRSVVAGLHNPAAGPLDVEQELSEKLEPGGPTLNLRAGGRQLTIITASISVQFLSNLPDTIDLLGCDWSLVRSDLLTEIVKSKRIHRVMITSYPGRYIDPEPLIALRRAYPGIEWYSTLQSGGTTFRFGTEQEEVYVRISL
jgi:hypothetical protein